MSTTQYGIRVTSNRFELSDLDDEDPLEILKMREKEMELKKKSKLAEKENKGKEVASKSNKSISNKTIKQSQNTINADNQKGKEETVTSKPSQQNDRFDRKFTGDNRDDRNVSGRNYEDRQTGGDFYNKEERNDRFDRRDNRPDWNNSYGGDNNFEGRRGRGRGGGTFVRGGRGRAGTRQNFDNRGNFDNNRGGGGGGGGFYDNRGKREFDRQSGSEKTGVKTVDKKDGYGSWNWGNPKDGNVEDTLNTTPQYQDDNECWNTPTSPEKPEQDPVEETNTRNTETDEVAPTTEETQEIRELTLDEWKALKGPRQAPTYNIRKAGEGEDLSQWKKMYALRKKKEEEGEEDDEEYEYDTSEYPQRVGRQKHVLDIDIHFKDTRGIVRGRGGRGGRGGGNRSSYQANPDHINTSHNSVPKIIPKVDDEHDFPSLS